MKFELIDIRGAYTETVPTFALAGRRRPFAGEIRLPARAGNSNRRFGREVAAGEAVIRLVNFVQRMRHE